MPAVCVAHGKMRTAGDDDDDRPRKPTSSWQAEQISKMSKHASLKSKYSAHSKRNTKGSNLPAGFNKSGAAELTHPKVVKALGERSESQDQRVMERLLSSKLFGHLLDRGSAEQIKQTRQASRAGRFLQSMTFKVGITFLICLSAVQMGVATDVDTEGAQVIWDVCEQVFTAIFALEVLIKLYVDGLPFFVDAWNVCDFFIAVTSALDAWILPLSGIDADIGFIRTFRLLRLLRIMRMLRIIPEILMVMEGIGASLRSLFWIIILLVAVLYACSIMCVEVIGKAKDDFPSYSEEADDLLVSSRASMFNNYMFFGTVPRSMVSLLGIVFLAEWDVIIRPVFEEYPAMVLMFTLIVILMTLGVLNIIVGVIVENTTQAMERERRSKVQDSKNKKMEFIEELAEVFLNIDEDCDGALTWQECQKAALKGDQKLAQLVFDIDFPPGITFEEIFQILDVDASGAITQDEFINGMFRIVHCDNFQRDCMHYLAVGRVMSKLNNDKTEILNAIRFEVHKAVQEVFQICTSDDFSVGGSSHEEMINSHSPGKLSEGCTSLSCSEMAADFNPAEYEEDPTMGAASTDRDALETSRPFSPRLGTELRTDVISRLTIAARAVETKMGDLMSMLREAQRPMQMQMQKGSTDRQVSPAIVHDLRSGGLCIPPPSLPSSDYQFEAWQTSSRKRSNQLQSQKVQQVSATKGACTPGHRLIVEGHSTQ